MGDGTYLTAQICPNGHVITSQLEWSQDTKHCPDCGQPTLRACKCGAPIRGYYHIPAVISGGKYSAPAYCHVCGSAFPWTESRLEAAKDLILEASDLDDTEKAALTGTLEDLLATTPRTEVAALKFKRLAAKAGVEIAGALRSVMIDVMSEAARKSVFGS